MHIPHLGCYKQIILVQKDRISIQNMRWNHKDDLPNDLISDSSLFFSVVFSKISHDLLNTNPLSSSDFIFSSLPHCSQTSFSGYLLCYILIHWVIFVKTFCMSDTIFGFGNAAVNTIGKNPSYSCHYLLPQPSLMHLPFKVLPLAFLFCSKLSTSFTISIHSLVSILPVC